MMVIGGSEIYNLFLPLASTIYLTRVHTELKGDTYLPPIDWSQWQLLQKELIKADEKNQYDFDFEVWKK